MYKIKQIPEDFIVEEIYDLEFKENGRYSYFRMQKRDYTTIKAIDIIARRIRIRPKFINFAGTKDKVAITYQNISISKGPRKDYDFGDIKLKFLGLGDKRLNLGCLDKNRFTIVVRNITTLPDTSTLIEGKYVLNLFDDQRFGKDKNNHIVGKHIVKKEFDKACNILGLDVKTDNIGALRKIPKKILLMYVHAYQSKLWNDVVLKLFNKKDYDIDLEIPIIGFMSEDTTYYKDISKEDFRMQQMPELFMEGSSRKMFVKLDDLNISELAADELNGGMKKCTITFSLPKGAYATRAIKTLFHNI